MAAVSLDVGRMLVDDASCEAVLGTVREMAEDWGIIFLAECDAHMTANHQLDVGDHFCRRYWAGPGSLPYAIVVRNSKSHCLRSVVQKGRACRVHLADGKSLDVCFVFFAWCEC